MILPLIPNTEKRKTVRNLLLLVGLVIFQIWHSHAPQIQLASICLPALLLKRHRF